MLAGLVVQMTEGCYPSPCLWRHPSISLIQPESLTFPKSNSSNLVYDSSPCLQELDCLLYPLEPLVPIPKLKVFGFEMQHFHSACPPAQLCSLTALPPWFLLWLNVPPMEHLRIRPFSSQMVSWPFKYPLFLDFLRGFWEVPFCNSNLFSMGVFSCSALLSSFGGPGAKNLGLP